MPTFAAVDIGSNSVRLKIGRLAHHRIQPLYEDREVVRLGEGVFQTGELQPVAIARTVKVLRRFHKAVQEHAVDQVRVVATSATRDSRNAQAFVDWVRAATGWQVETISGSEEARLIHLGIISNTRLPANRILLLDLGGGSCELTVSKAGHIESAVSVPLGAVRLTREFLEHDPPKKDELRRLRSFIGEELKSALPRIRKAHPQSVIATSGTAEALAGAARAFLKGPKRRRVFTVTSGILKKITKALARMNAEERTQFRGIGPKRAEIIVPGAMVFSELLQRAGLKGFRYLPLGLRDGLLAQMAADYDALSRSRKVIELDRWNSVLELCKRYDVDLEHAQQVRRLALELFHALKRIHNLPPEYQEWLSAAAMLHEVGGYVNRTGWLRHAQYIIANSELVGYTPEQRQIIAAVGRYLGNTMPWADEKNMKLLKKSDQEMVPKAVGLLRLSRALNTGRRQAVVGLGVRVKEDKITLRLRTRRRVDADLEMWVLKKDRSYFREVFGRELSVAAE